MNDLSVIGNPLANARCWRISFETTERADAMPAAILREPVNRYAVAHEVSIDDAMQAPASDDGNSILLVWLPRGDANVPGTTLQVEDWIRAGQRPGELLVRASIRTILVLWSSTRAAIFSGVDEFEHAIDAVVRFTMAARQTFTLEAQVMAAWSEVESHVALTHALSRPSLEFQPQVNDMTEAATRMKVMHLRLLNALQQLDLSLTIPSKLLFSELALQAQLPGKLERLENPVQFLLDHYELANTRLIEGRFNRRMVWLELGILVIIAADFVALTLELLR